MTTPLVVFVIGVLPILSVLSMIGVDLDTDLMRLIAKVLRGLLRHVASPEKVGATGNRYCFARDDGGGVLQAQCQHASTHM